MHSVNSHGSEYNNIYCIITFMKPQPCSYMGIEWYLEKRGSWKILVDLEISSVFLMGLKFSFLGDFWVIFGYILSKEHQLVD